MNTILQNIHGELNITRKMVSAYLLEPQKEPALEDLEVVDIDFEGKPFLLIRKAAEGWRKMRAAAQSDAVILEPHSGFRSYLYQKSLIQRKLGRGRPLDVILTETAIPGFSEHHTGRAVDICTDGIYRLTEDFEKTEAFAWLKKNAGTFGFTLSYPRGNAKGIVFEPWHWFFKLP